MSPDEIEELKSDIAFLRQFVDEQFFGMMAEGVRSDNHDLEFGEQADSDEHHYNRIQAIWRENE